MMLRDRHAGRPGEGRDEPHAGGPGSPRLRMLLSEAGWRRGTVVDQLPRLLEPLGIRTVRAASGEEAADLIRSVTIHIAVVDLAIPLHRDAERSPLAGPRVLELLRRLEQPPPTVVVRPRPAATRESVRTLSRALREGAFAVVDRPVDLETMLEVLRRILRRYYADVWPDDSRDDPQRARPRRPTPRRPDA
jgi:CheY-like chemotaxis protein